MKLGESWQINDDTLSFIEEFSCVLYGNKQVKSVNELTFFMSQSKYGREDGSLYIRKF